MKLEFKHLVPYLPYGLSFIHNGEKHHISYEYIEADGFTIDDLLGEKPILRPLSDLTEKELDMFSISDRNYIKLISNSETYHFGSLTYSTVRYLCQEHYDFQNLIPKGLAIDNQLI